jgi:hypothetical protein
MIDLLSSMQILLREAGFTTHLTSVDNVRSVSFEDDALVGFASSFSSPTELLSRWKPIETAILTRHSQSLRKAGEKAWNVYVVLLCAAAADPIVNRQVCWIEEDLERTRKIAACGLGNREDLVRALLPLLPFQYQPALQVESVKDRLQRRIGFIAPVASDVALDDSVAASDVVSLLGQKP